MPDHPTTAPTGPYGWLAPENPMTYQAPELLPGPCCICGDTNYALSFGGPTICPKCDCGHFDAATVMKQAKLIETLRSELERARRLLTLTRPPAERPVPQVREALRTAISHIDHMAAFITNANSDYHCGTYSFESLGEDMPGIRAALTAERPEAAVAWRVLCTTNGATGYLYTEQLPFDPGPGVRVRREPEPLYAIPHEEPGRETMTSGQTASSINTQTRSK